MNTVTKTTTAGSTGDTGEPVVGKPKQEQPPVWPPSREELENSTNVELGQRYGVTLGKIKHVRESGAERIPMNDETRKRAYAERNNRVPADFDEEIEDPTTPEAFDELFNAVAAVKHVKGVIDPKRHKIGLTLRGEKPVGIVFTSDWQLGSEGVDYEHWRDDLDLLKAAHEEDPEGLLAVGLGDYSSHLSELGIPGAGNRDLLPSNFQVALVKGAFHQTVGMWLILLKGCHDSFPGKKADYDPVAEYCLITGARHGWHGAEVKVRLGSQEYTWRLRHKYRFNSEINPGNSQRREIEMEGPADLVAHAHRHTSFVNWGTVAGRDAVMLRSGSYQIYDDFARQQVGNVKADPRMPMVVFYPDRHEMMPFRDFRTGLNFLKQERARG